MKLATKFSIGITTIVIMAITTVSGFIVYSNQQRLAVEIHQHHQQLTKQLAQAAEESLYESGLIFLNQSKRMKQERGFVSACFVNNENTVRFHSDVSRVDTPFMAASADTVDYTAPVTFVEQPVGNVHLFISKATMKAFLREALMSDLKRIGAISALVLTLAIVGVLLFANAMVAPIRRVVDGMQDVARGRRDAIAFPSRKDELGWMGNELNATITKLKELDDMKRDFVAGITHDLRSPIDVIQGFVTMQLNESHLIPKEREREILLQIQNNASRLRGLIDDLLLTSRLEANREEFDRAQFDLNHVVTEIGTFYETAAQQKKLAFTIAANATPAFVWGDRDKTVQVLHNLLSNALKYTATGSVTVEVDATSTNTVRVNVKDTGGGIPPAERTKIFEKFFRSPSNSKQAKGTGLGLSITKALVEGQKGKIGVEPNPAGGSIFWFTLPR